MKRLLKILFVVAPLLISGAAIGQQQTPADTTESKLRFFDKIGHWLVAYNMTGPEFLATERTAFKASAFAEVYVEATIEHQAWMFAMLNRVTLARLLPEERQNPHVLITVKFNPNEDVSQYTVDFSIAASGQVNENLSQVSKLVKEKYLDGKVFTDPASALATIEPALREALQRAAEKIGDKLAPNVLVRYNGELFWSGHTIDVLAVEGNYVELEAVDKDREPLNAASLTWTNADPFDGHKGIVDMTGVPAKLVTLRFDSESLSVTLKRVDIGQDVNDLLKQLIVEALSAKKQEALDTLVVLRRDSAANATQIRDYITHLESGNFPMEGTDRPVPMFANPTLRADSSDLLNEQVNRDIARSLKELKRKARLRHTLRRKLNVVAFADLVVERPERMKDLLDELLRNSGRLVARLILNTDSKGQRDEARDIVLEFLNQHLEKIVGRYYPPGLSLEPPLAIPQPVANATFDPAKFLYINPLVNFEGKQELVTRLNAYLPTQDPPLYVFINYSHDLSVAGYQSRVTGTRPAGLPPGARYKVFTVVHMPGSVKEVTLALRKGRGAVTTSDAIEEEVENKATADQLALAEKAIPLLGDPAYLETIEKIKEIYDFFNRCQDEDWSSFRKPGIVPYCFWRDQTVNNEYKYRALDRPFVAGLVDGAFSEADGIYQFPGLAKKISQSPGKILIAYTLRYLACTPEKMLAHYEDLEYVMEELAAMEREKNPVKRYFNWVVEMWVDKEEERDELLQYFKECHEASALRDDVVEVYETITSLKEIVALYVSVENQLRSYFTKLGNTDNIARYEQGRLVVPVAATVLSLGAVSVTKLGKVRGVVVALREATAENWRRVVDDLGKTLAKRAQTFAAKSGSELKSYLNSTRTKPLPKVYRGSLFKSVSKESESLHSAKPNVISEYSIEESWGRYDLQGESGMYYSNTLDGNQVEMTHYGDWNKYSTYEYKSVEVDNMLDLTDDVVREQLAVELEKLVLGVSDKSKAYEFTNVLGTWARGNGYKGLIVPGARGGKDYANIVIFNQADLDGALRNITPAKIK